MIPYRDRPAVLGAPAGPIVREWNTPREVPCPWCEYLSAALPPIWGGRGRDWNGRPLKPHQKAMAKMSHEVAGCMAAFEYLSDSVW